MFRPNTEALIYRRSGRPDRRGEYTYETPTRIACGVVKLGAMSQKTSVRADSSGSRGKATEDQGDSVILFPMFGRIAEGDIIKIDGSVMEIVGIFPRRNVLGRLDHQEAHLVAAQEPVS